MSDEALAAPAGGSTAEPSDQDIRPVIRTGYGGNRGAWVFGGVLMAGTIMVFAAMAGRREALVAPATTIVPGPSPGVIASPPKLLIPDDGERDWTTYPRIVDRYAAPPDASYTPYVPGFNSAAQAPANREPAAQVVPAYPEPVPTPIPRLIAQGPAVVYDARTAGQAIDGDTSSAQADRPGSERVRAGRLTNPSMTVPLGTVIPAVLETALDSTRPGAVRAITARDVLGFDGSRILIPRGSRLYGEYDADLGAGQNRALIRWKRLIRPDGALIALDSPASDPLGRAGIKGKVNSHFFERFGSAILQSVLEVGVSVASRRVARDGVIVALPGSTQNVTGSVQGQQVQRTLTVRQGTSVSVFVARDLDFSPVEI